MLDARAVVKTYVSEGVPTPALKGVDLTLEQGEFVALVGRSGSGKSTLLHVMSTLLRPDGGKVRYKGEDLAAASPARLDAIRRREFAMIFQFHHLIPYLSALENTLLPAAGVLRGESAAARERALACLERVGLKGKERRLPSQLSGGEQQRVAIARGLAAGASVLFADEPTGSLDKANGEGILRLLTDLNATGTTILMVTHDPQYATRAGRVVTMEDGLMQAA